MIAVNNGFVRTNYCAPPPPSNRQGLFFGGLVTPDGKLENSRIFMAIGLNPF